MKKMKALLMIFLLVLGFSTFLNGNVLIKRKYIASLIYTRDKTPGAAMAVQMFRKSLISAMKNLYSSYIYHPDKVARFYANNVINKENFVRMQKSIPDIDYFVTARLYNLDRDIHPNSIIRIRISIYRIRDGVKRTERFFASGRLGNYESMIYSICKNVTSVTRLPISETHVRLLPYDVISQYARARYFYALKNYALSSAAFRSALEKHGNPNPTLIKNYVNSIIRQNGSIAGLKPAGENPPYLELAASRFYLKKKDYNKALEYALSYKKSIAERETIVEPIEQEYRVIHSEIYSAIIMDKKAVVFNKNKITEKFIHTFAEKIKTAGIISDFLVINGKHYDIKNPGTVFEKPVLIQQEPLTVTHEQRENKWVFVHNNKGITNVYEGDVPENTLLSFRHPLYVLASGRQVFVFGRLSGRLIWQQTLDYEIKSIQTQGANVILMGKDSLSYFVLENGRLIKFKKYKSAEQILVSGNVAVAVYKDRMFYEDMATNKKWNKSFNSLNVKDIQISGRRIEIILSDKETVSYYYILNESGEEIYRKLFYGKLLFADIVSRLFFYDNSLTKIPRMSDETNYFHLSLSMIYQGLNNQDESFKYALLALKDNPVSFPGLKYINQLLTGLTTQESKEKLRKQFAEIFGGRLKNLPDAAVIDRVLSSFFVYPFYKEGYSEILKISGIKTPENVISLSIGSIRTYKMLDGFLVVSLKSKRVEVIQPSTGKIIWSMNRFEVIRSLPDMNERIFLYNASESLLLSVNYKTGGLLWMNPIGSSHFNSKIRFALINGKIIALSKLGDKTRISGIDPSSGNTLYTREIEGTVIHDKKDLFVFHDNKLFKKNITGFSDEWEAELEHSERKMELTSEYVIVFYAKKIIYFKRDNGVKSRTYKFPQGIISYSTGENGNLLVLYSNEDGKKILGMFAGTQKTEIEIGNKTISKIQLPNGYAFIVTADETLIRDGNSLKPLISFHSHFHKIQSLNDRYYLFTGRYCIIISAKPIKIQATAFLKKRYSGHYWYYGGIFSSNPL